VNAGATEQKCDPDSERVSRKRICFVVSHPIQYTVPLYQRLARRDDVAIKVFFTWHAGGKAVEDRGFGRAIAWDIPLTQGYEFEPVPNVAAAPGTDRLFGLRNPALLDRVMTWRPDVVHVTGWAWYSHLQLLRALHRRGVPTLFFGDSHLLDGKIGGPRWWMKSAVLRRVYSWPTACLYAGSANRAYFEVFGVPPQRLYPCPHAIDVGRFAEPAGRREEEAARWRSELGIALDRKVLLYAGKFEQKKRPTDLMRAFARLQDPSLMLVMVGSGELQAACRSFTDWAMYSSCRRVMARVGALPSMKLWRAGGRSLSATASAVRPTWSMHRAAGYFLGTIGANSAKPSRPCSAIPGNWRKCAAPPARAPVPSMSASPRRPL
jgi:glycosyltransferase involved in cell wall biosynthesis